MDIEDFRPDPASVEHVGVEEIVEHYEVIVRELDTSPIIMGHLLGGASTQILLDRGLGAAGVAIDSAPVKGILTLPLSTLKSSFPALKNPANRHKAVTPSPRRSSHYAFTNTLTEEESLAVYERYAALASGRVLRLQAGLANFNLRAATKVDFSNDDRAPLLVIAGGSDHVSPDSVNESTGRSTRASPTQSPPTRSFPAAPTSSSARTAGKKSPTTHSGLGRRDRSDQHGAAQWIVLRQNVPA